MKTSIRFFLFLALLPAALLQAEQFKYTYETGSRFRILSTVHEDVYVDRKFSHHAEILNRIAASVKEAKGQSGQLEATFQTSEQVDGTGGRGFKWEREYQSAFARDERGLLSIGREYWMPVVRNVPVLPAGEIKAGDSWSEPGEEVHDFRDGFGLEEPYRIPFTANYRYTGEEVVEGKSYAVFSASYRIFNEPSMPKDATFWPIRIMGASDQKIFWDRELGQPGMYEERFRMVFELSNGRTIEYRGTAEARVIEAIRMDRQKVADEIQKEISSQGIADTAVRVTDDGVAISLENIQFSADSSSLLPAERTKLDRIGKILKKYADRDILVGGHTALAGTEQGRQKLSEERALCVANYLLDTGVRTRDRIVTRGFGATQPLSSNTSEEDKQKNRRVEIILLEN